MPVTDDIHPTDSTVDISVTLTESVLEAVEIVRANWPTDEFPSRSYVIRELLRLGIVAALSEDARPSTLSAAYQ